MSPSFHRRAAFGAITTALVATLAASVVAHVAPATAAFSLTSADGTTPHGAAGPAGQGASAGRGVTPACSALAPGPIA